MTRCQNLVSRATLAASFALLCAACVDASALYSGDDGDATDSSAQSETDDMRDRDLSAVTDLAASPDLLAPADFALPDLNPSQCNQASDCPKLDGGATVGCCHGACVNISDDIANCGSCGAACSIKNDTPTCASGVCALSCNAAFGDCNHNASDGCEASFLTDLNNCGGCGQICSAMNDTPNCTNGACVLFCNAGFADCNHLAADGCEVNLQTDPNNCGACGASFTETLCNGVDDNCNGLVDEGCPNGIKLDLTQSWTSSGHGGMGGGPWGPWPNTQAPMTSMSGTSGCYVNEFSPTSSAFQVAANQMAIPYTYNVSLAAGVAGPSFGGGGGGAFSGGCTGPNQVMTGILGAAGDANVVDSIGAHCATVTITGAKPYQYGISLTNAGKIGPWGAGLNCAGGTAFDDPCPAGYVVGSWQGRDGAYLDAVQVTCFPLILTVK